MTIAAGTRLGPYEIVALLGAGGMGEVYRATDTRLKRKVAIKVLPALAALDPVSRERFEREAQLVSQLNHPNICMLYDVGREGDIDFLVMEYLEGQTLAERLLRGALPLEEGLKTAIEIALALEKAHRQGIVHRDLKPGNVMLTKGGAKLLDFGLAKMRAESLPGMSKADTARAALTEEGAVLGTIQYMAPEQLDGERADARSDIFSFGALLYEIVTGRPAFEGKTQASLMAAIIGREPRPVTELQPLSPLALDDLIRDCLAKAPDDRWQAVSDVRRQLQRIAAGRPKVAPEAQRTNAGPAAIARRVRLAWAAAAAAAISLVIAVAEWPRTAPLQASEPVRMTVGLPTGISLTRSSWSPSLALSPDGRALVVAGTDADGQSRLYARPLDRFEATALEGTEGGSSPFFSPDGEWIGFFAEGRLKRVSFSGGAPVEITVVPDHLPAGASWGPDGRIAFVSGARSWVHVVDEGGGRAETLVPLADGELFHLQPEYLPDGRTLLFAADGWIHAFDISTGRRVALTQGTTPRYSASGHVIFVRDATLLAAPFDRSRLELTGPPVPLVQNVAGDSARHYAISPNGHVAYVPGADAYELVLRQADGRERLVTEPSPRFENPRFSPDGRKIAVAAITRAGELADIWIHDLQAGTDTRLTFDGGRAPVWTVDGTAVTFSHVGENQGIYTKRVDGRGEPQQVTAVDQFHWLVGWTPDARVLVYGRMEPPAADGSTNSSIVTFADGTTQRIVGPGGIWGGRLSPDGEWLVYYSLVAGRYEVYVTPFPGVGARWLISDQGGSDPSWAPDGTEIYYRNADRLLAARVDTTEGVRVVSRRLLVEPFSPPAYDDYHMHPNGSLVLVRPLVSGGEVQLVLNSLGELSDSRP